MIVWIYVHIMCNYMHRKYWLYKVSIKLPKEKEKVIHNFAKMPLFQEMLYVKASSIFMLMVTGGVKIKMLSRISPVFTTLHLRVYFQIMDIGIRWFMTCY